MRGVASPSVAFARIKRRGAAGVACAIACAAVGAALPHAAAAQEPAAVGLYNWVHTTADAERAFPFFRDVLGLALAHSHFRPPDNRPVTIQPAAEAGSDALVWDLTDTKGSRFRTVFMAATNTPFGLELSEFFDIPRGTRQANAWDPGAATLIFSVRDLDGVLARVRARGDAIVTVGGAAVATPAGRAVVVRDPDGCLIELAQASPSELANAGPGEVVRTAIGITVASTAEALKFYRGLLGFEVRGTHRATDAELRLRGLAAGTLTETALGLAGTDLSVQLAEFTVPADVAPPAPFRWRIQDVGAPQLQLQVRGLDPLLERTKAAGYGFLSIGGRPIQRAFGRFVFAKDPDGVLVEFVEPAARD
jgi:catechol 2,3-dioxygenase-like lactoylglutathione lyase family enzyme